MNLLDVELDYARYIIPGIVLGLASSFLSRFLIQFGKTKLDTLIRIVLQVIISVAILHILQQTESTQYLVDGSPVSTGVFQAFFFSTQVYMFADIASLIR